jgi:hypothetical protein
LWLVCGLVGVLGFSLVRGGVRVFVCVLSVSLSLSLARKRNIVDLNTTPPPSFGGPRVRGALLQQP